MDGKIILLFHEALMVVFAGKKDSAFGSRKILKRK